MNVFRMFAKMKGQRLQVESDGAVSLDAIMKDGVRAQPDVSAIASRERDTFYVLAWHYHDDDVLGPDAAVELSLENVPRSLGSGRVDHFRIDRSHSNSYEAWKQLGSPADPTSEQRTALQQAGQLEKMDPTATLRVDGDRAMLRFTLPRQAVSLLVISPKE